MVKNLPVSAEKEKISPCIKWAGGKGQILGEIEKRMPSNFENYFEPFVGAGSVLFFFQPSSAFINDINPQLINLYRQIQSDPEKVISAVNALDAEECNAELYFKNREEYNRRIKEHILDCPTASLFIWLNKHCFNGLYRVNSKGFFNVPYNNRSKGSSIDRENIRSMSKYLKKVKMSCLDFEEAVKNAAQGDFVYFDSPYFPESPTANFTSYAKEGFLPEDHERLARVFKELDKKGVRVMLSNNDVEAVRELYRGYRIESFEVKRMINRDANKRRGKEVIVTNYDY